MPKGGSSLRNGRATRLAVLELLMHSPEGMTRPQIGWGLSMEDREVGRTLQRLSLGQLIEKRGDRWHYVALPLNGPKRKA